VSKDVLTQKRRLQNVVPSSLVKQVLEGIHDEAGHQGQRRTLSLARQRTNVANAVKVKLKNLKEELLWKESKHQAPWNWSAYMLRL